jgi:hypothetical protein
LRYSTEIHEPQVRRPYLVVATLHEIADRGGQGAFDRALEGEDGNAVTAFGLGRDGAIVVTAQRASDIHPLSMQRSAGRPVGGRSAAQALGVRQKFGRELRAPGRSVGEKGLQGRTLYEFGCMTQSPLSVLAGFNKAIQNRSRV